MEKKGKIRQSLRNSFIDGAFCSAMIGFVDQYITPFAVALKATSEQIGMLTAFPNLVASLIQLKSADVTEHLKSRMRIIRIFVFFHAFMFLPILLIPLIFTTNRALWLILFVTMAASFNAFPGPAWTSLMADHLPARSRGKYFGWRNRLLGMITVACAFLAGFILNIFGKDKLYGFMVILGLAFVSRFISWYFLSKMYEPPIKVTREHYFTFWDFIKRTKQSNFAKFVIYVASISFAQNISGPFFAVYMIRDLNLSYGMYTIIVTSSTIATLLTMGIWGRHADVVGNMKVIRLTSFFIPVIPVLWLFSHNVYYLIIIQLFAGYVWAGFNLSIFNFVYDAVTPEKRTRCVSYFNVINGTAICCGALLGGFLAKSLPPISGQRLLTLFLLSGVLRAVFSATMLPMIKEVRRVEKISSLDLFFSITRLRPIEVEGEKDI
ncbi:MAG: MFS transporter [Candidatus Omnitrophica bacterium]|nr:MFS transporter [Candidatus Omnitrophota bacterium]